MSKELAELITDISLYSIYFPIIIGAFRWKKLEAIQKWIGLLVLVTLLGELGLNLMHQLLHNNLPFIHLFTVSQFIVFTVIMKKTLAPFIPSWIFLSAILIIVIIAIADSIWWSGLGQFNHFARPAANIFLIFFALMFYYKAMVNLDILYLERHPVFWLSSGAIIYFSGSLFIFLFTNYMITSNEALLTLWGIHAIFNIILNACYALALWGQMEH